MTGGKRQDLTPAPELADSMAALLATPAPPPKRAIGFIDPEDKGSKKTSGRARLKA